MPVKITRVKGGKYRVSTPGGVKAKATTKEKAKRQANLLRAVDHGWKPSGKPARKAKRKRTGGGAKSPYRKGKNNPHPHGDWRTYLN